MSSDLEKERLGILAHELSPVTAQRAVSWERRDNDVYAWSAEEGTVTIDSRDSDGEPPYELTVYNQAGEKVDELASELVAGDEPAPWNGALAELYRAARRSALGADDIIDALLGRVRAAGDNGTAGSNSSLFSRA